MAAFSGKKGVSTLHTHHLFPEGGMAVRNSVCVCADPWLAPSVSLPERRDAEITLIIPLFPNQSKGVKGGEMEHAMERDTVPKEKKWTSSLMRGRTLMQTGIDSRWRSVRRYLTVTEGERAWAWMCLYLSSVSWSICCLFHLLRLSLHEQPVIILLSALMDFWWFAVFFFPPTHRNASGRVCVVSVWDLVCCLVISCRSCGGPVRHLDKAMDQSPRGSMCSFVPLWISRYLCP